MHHFGNVERRKYILQEEPGDEAARPDAAKPNIPESQNRKIAAKAWPAMFRAFALDLLWLANQFPNQPGQSPAAYPGSAQSPSPTHPARHPSRPDLSSASSPPRS